MKKNLTAAASRFHRSAFLLLALVLVTPCAGKSLPEHLQAARQFKEILPQVVGPNDSATNAPGDVTRFAYQRLENLEAFLHETILAPLSPDAPDRLEEIFGNCGGGPLSSLDCVPGMRSFSLRFEVTEVLGHYRDIVSACEEKKQPHLPVLKDLAADLDLLQATYSDALNPANPAAEETVNQERTLFLRFLDVLRLRLERTLLSIRYCRAILLKHMDAFESAHECSGECPDGKSQTTGEESLLGQKATSE